MIIKINGKSFDAIKASIEVPALLIADEGVTTWHVGVLSATVVGPDDQTVWRMWSKKKVDRLKIEKDGESIDLGKGRFTGSLQREKNEYSFVIELKMEHVKGRSVQ